MARTKQTARKSTGGKAPRKQLATKKDWLSMKKENSENENSENSLNSSEEYGMVRTPREYLVDTLQSLKDTPGKFAVDGIMGQSPFPGLEIEGVGPICLPICASAAKRIIEVARQAPFGLGENTVVDENVRKCWEIAPSQVSFQNPQFKCQVLSLVLKIKSELGCDSNHVKANFYKLLLYEEGGHFKPHTDSEKEDGMFGTLIVQLPSIFKGNDLVVHHGDKTKTVHFDCKRSAYDFVYAAHYSDCKHEVTPLDSGYRLALIYNLVWTAPTVPPSLQQHDRTRQIIADLLTRMKGIFGWTLDHQYSDSSLENGIAALKGKDRNIAASLRSANSLLDKDNRVDYYIATVKRETIESGDHCGYGYYGSGEFEPCDVVEDRSTLSDGHNFNGGSYPVEEIPFDIEEDMLDFEVKYNGDLDKFWGDYDDEEVEGPTGNEGSTRSRWYSNYIILAVPRNQRFYLLCKSSLEKALERLNKESLKALPEVKTNLKTFLNVFSSSDFSDDKSSLGKIMEILTRLADVHLVKMFIIKILKKCPQTYYWNRKRDEKKEAFGLYFEGMEDSYCLLFQSVQWNDIKHVVESLIAKCPTMQFARWMAIAKHIDAIDISHKVIEVAIQKIEGNHWSPKSEEYPLLIRLIQDLFASDELFSRWWMTVSLLGIFQDINLLVTLIAEVPTNRTEGYSHLLQSFNETLDKQSDVKNIAKYSPLVFKVVKPIIEKTEFKDHLQSLCKSLVLSGHIAIIGRVLSSLLKHKESLLHSAAFQMFLNSFVDSLSHTKLDDALEVVSVLSCLGKTTNHDLQAKLVHYSHLFHQQAIKPDLEVYSSSLSNMFLMEDWCNQLDENLLANMISANSVNDFEFYASAILTMPVYKFSSYKFLLRSAVKALEVYLSTVSPEYELLAGFVRVLLNNDVDDDIFHEFVSSNNLIADDRSKMFSSTHSFLQMLIRDLKKNELKKTPKLLMARVENLLVVQSRGPPAFDWCQPNARIDGHPKVQNFLRSNQRSFTYQNFNGINDARKWDSKWFGYNRNQISRGYSCHCSTNGVGKKAHAILTKNDHFYKEKKNKFDELMKELKMLTTEIKVSSPALLFVTTTKQTSNDTNTIKQPSCDTKQLSNDTKRAINNTNTKRPMAENNCNVPAKKHVIVID